MNTTTQVGIYNMSLGAIGVSRFVNSLTDTTPEARTLNVFWEACRDQALQDFPWGFAMRYADLQSLQKRTPGWIFTYGYPADCLQARFIVPRHYHGSCNQSAQVAPGYQYVFWNPWHYFYNDRHKVPFEVVENEAGGGLGIVTNEPYAKLAYTARIKTITLWTPAFVSALSWLLAARAAAPLSAKPEYAQAAGQAYRAAIDEAAALAMNEGAEKDEPESEFIEARY